jgi:hypothetical protein
LCRALLPGSRGAAACARARRAARVDNFYFLKLIYYLFLFLFLF